MRTLGIDYGDARVGLAITDPLGITAQGLETIHHDGNDKIVLKRLEEIVNTYEIDTFAIGMPYNMDGTKSERAEITEKFIHKLNCKFNKIRIVPIDERLTTVEAHKTMNFLNVNKHKKRNIVDTIAAIYILESYMKLNENAK
jgi:putative Holliday junction resolvase